MTEDEAWAYPDLMKILEREVRPYREEKAKEVADWPWWRFWRTRQELYDIITPLKRVLVTNAQASSYLSFIFYQPNVVFANSLNIFPLEKDSDFAVLQSRVHEVFAWFFSSSFEDRIRYNPTDCFETFPFPKNWETDPTLEAIGKIYYEFRADLMVRTNQGLTDTYNDFHNPTHHTPDIFKLRDLHEQMDRAVLNAYGWHDIDTTCGYALDYLDIDPDDLSPEAAERVASGDLFFPTAAEAAAFNALVRSGSGKRGKSKLPWRYRWPEATHDEVLARLLDLNQKRHEEEILGGKQAPQGQKAKGKRQRKAKSEIETPTIPGMDV